MATVYPHWICQECGAKASKGRQFSVSCWHIGICDICGKEKPTTEARDFYHPDFGNSPKEVDKKIELTIKEEE